MVKLEVDLFKRCQVQDDEMQPKALEMFRTVNFTIKLKISKIQELHLNEQQPGDWPKFGSERMVEFPGVEFGHFVQPIFASL